MDFESTLYAPSKLNNFMHAWLVKKYTTYILDTTVLLSYLPSSPYCFDA